MMPAKFCEQQKVGRPLLMQACFMIRQLLQDFCQLSLAEGFPQS